jgi:hypothetical protein
MAGTTTATVVPGEAEESEEEQEKEELATDTSHKLASQLYNKFVRQTGIKIPAKLSVC